jgi:hypothetical protein
LVIKENTLDYGLYQFTLQVDVSFNGMIVSSSAQTYVQIIPTGLAVFALENGVSSVIIGSKQAFSLQPTTYTFDRDDIIQPSQLTFVYYCKTINISDPNSVNTQTSIFDLSSYKNNTILSMDRTINCFGNNSKDYKYKKKL